MRWILSSWICLHSRVQCRDTAQPRCISATLFVEETWTPVHLEYKGDDGWISITPAIVIAVVANYLLSSTVSRRSPRRKGPLRPDWSRCTHTPPFLTSTQTNGVSVRLPPPPDMLSTGDHRHDDAYLRFTPSRGCQPGRRYRIEFGMGQKVGIWRRSRSRCLTRPPRL